MLRTRIITAFFLVVGLLLALFQASSQVWMLLTFVVAMFAVSEWANLIKLSKAQSVGYVLIAGALGLFIFYIKTVSADDYHRVLLAILALSVLFWVVLAPLWLAQKKSCHHQWLMSGLGLVLIFATWFALVGLHDISPWLLLGIITAVSLADSAAYFAGKRFGRHKLAPAISPGKTWEGVAGAILGVTLYGLVLCYVKQYNAWLVVALWLVVVWSVMGDLFESLLKRQAGIKDSGSILPGHGGVLDRIDGFIPTLPIVLFFHPYFHV